MTFSLAFGTKFIRDIQNPLAEEIDVSAIEPRLSIMRRFSNNPKALTVAQHRNLAVILARHDRARSEVLTYLQHHDDHEAFIGDIPSPIKNLIGQHTDVLARVEAALDAAIWEANGQSYYLPWSDTEERGTAVFREAHEYDKLAETLEWQFAMNEKPQAWNRGMTDFVRSNAIKMIYTARIMSPARM